MTIPVPRLYDASMQTRTDVIVVGAGPIGLELAVALKRGGVDYLHFDAAQIGQTIYRFPPQTRFFSSNERIAVAGVPLQTFDQNKSTREQYLAYLRAIVEQFDLQVNTYEPVVGIDQRDGGFAVTTQSGGTPRSYWCKKLVLVTGGTDHPRRLNIPGEDLPHVSHYFTDPHIYFRKRLLIVGGKNSAVETALRCYNAGANVSISYRKAALPEKSIKYWLMPEIRYLIESGKIAAHFRTVPSRITSSSVTLVGCDEQGTHEQGRHEGTEARRHEGEGETDVGFKGRRSEGESACDVKQLPFDFVLLLTGYIQDNALLRLAGIDLRGECQAPVFDERTMQTNVPNVYIAGTAVGGTQEKYTVFIENCHVHVDRIMAALTGTAAPAPPAPIAQPES
jgi:thioredoxin reductase (NADPH)